MAIHALAHRLRMCWPRVGTSQRHSASLTSETGTSTGEPQIGSTTLYAQFPQDRLFHQVLHAPFMHYRNNGDQALALRGEAVLDLRPHHPEVLAVDQAEGGQLLLQIPG